MPFRLRYKLFIAFLSFNTILIGSMYFATVYTVGSGFDEYMREVEMKLVDRLVPNITQMYLKHGENWKFINRYPEQWYDLIDHYFSDPHEFDHPPISDSMLPFDPEDHPEEDEFEEDTILDIVILDENRQVITQHSEVVSNVPVKPIIHNQKTIGWIGIYASTELSLEEREFIEDQNHTFLLISIVMLVLSILASFGLSYHFERPIKRLIRGTKKLTSGSYQTQLVVDSRDELGQLSKDFNILAKTLDANEKARRQWAADISHELRTPLALLSGELQALKDGVRSMTPKTVDVLSTDVQFLTRLVNDLFELSMSDIGALNYKKTNLNLIEVLKDTVDMFTKELEKSQLCINQNYPSQMVTIFGDGERISQLMTNLIQNSINYTNPDGTISITTSTLNNQVTVEIEDSAPGVPDQMLPKLFDRLFRVEKSRSRALGGAGLGLSICKNIVEAHDGSITASPASIEGLKITMTFPIIT